MSQYIHCQKEEEELIEAMEEWIAACNARRGASKPQSIEETDQYIQAIDLAEKADKKFRDALKTHDDCIATWFKKRSQG